MISDEPYQTLKDQEHAKWSKEINRSQKTTADVTAEEIKATDKLSEKIRPQKPTTQRIR